MSSHEGRGFNLVEIATVLVIVGLLLGGVLKGQALVTDARVRHIVNDLDRVSAAVLAYRDRFTQMPGDDSEATGHFDTSRGGNGDGILDGAYDSAVAGQESRLLWTHLRRAQLIEGTGDLQPHHVFGDIIGVADGMYDLRGSAVCLKNIPGDIAHRVDERIDDGLPDDGNVRAGTARVPAAERYVSTAVYHLCARIGQPEPAVREEYVSSEPVPGAGRVQQR